MKRRFIIPLSFNPIPADALAARLKTYEGRHHNDLIDDFESGLRNLMGAGYAVGLSSGTAAIHLALKALDVLPNDFVLVSTFTYVASVNPIVYLQAIPVFIDCEQGGWNMDPDELEKAILSCQKEGKKPKAIIAVHNFGMPAKIEEILGLGVKYGIPVLEDAAEAIGSSYQNKSAGTWGSIGILSFNNNKTLTTFGGGALLTNDRATADKVLDWSTQSRKPMPYYEHDQTGFNYRIGPLNAAMGLVSLARLDENVLARREIFKMYQSGLGEWPGINWQRESEGVKSNRWISSFDFGKEMENIRKVLDGEGIETRPLWNPMHRQPVFKNNRAFINGNSDRLFRQGLCLPSGNDLEPQSLNKICRLILKNRLL